MRVSSKVQYAVRAVFDISFNGGGKPTQVKDAAERQGIPPRFLEQIFQDLKREGIVTSRRGPNGGYQLGRPAHEIKLSDIMRAVDGADALDIFALRTEAKPTALDGHFREIGRRVEECFSSVTIGELCERSEEQGIERKASRGYSYAI